MFAEPYRSVNDQHSTWVGQITKGSASKLALSGYILMCATFVVSVVSYSQFDALKVQITTISSVKSGSTCEMISGVSATKDLRQYLDMNDFFIRYNSEFGSSSCYSETTYTSSYNLGEIQYNNVFYSSFDDCEKQLATWSPTWSPTTINGGDPVFFLADMPSSYDVTNPIIYVYTDYSICNPPYLPSSEEFLNFMIANGYQSALRDGICTPFANNPPYKCTVFETKSYLEILSQSFAIATTFIGVYLALTRFILQSYPQYFMKAIQRVNAEKSLDMIELNSTENACDEQDPDNLITAASDDSEVEEGHIFSEREASSTS